MKALVLQFNASMQNIFTCWIAPTLLGRASSISVCNQIQKTCVTHLKVDKYKYKYKRQV